VWLGRADAGGPSVSTLRRSSSCSKKEQSQETHGPSASPPTSLTHKQSTRSSRALCPPCVTRATYSNHMTINYADTCRLHPLVVRISRSHISRLHHIPTCRDVAPYDLQCRPHFPSFMLAGHSRSPLSTRPPTCSRLGFLVADTLVSGFKSLVACSLPNGTRCMNEQAHPW
jgi:hypothetical protein